MNINNDNYKQFTYFILFLIGISVMISYGVSKVILLTGIQVPFYIDLPISSVAVYSMLFWLFDNFFWKLPIFRTIGIIKSDDLNGTWQGTVKSSYDNFVKDIKTELCIEQSATKIKIHGTFDKSKSISIHENFGFSDIDSSPALFYFFKNDPNYDAVETMAMHEGSAKLIHKSKKDELVGSYYSGRDRHNHGTISVKRIKK